LLEVAPDLPKVGADRAQLEQALLNLVSNAVDAMPSGGRLTLAARRQDQGVALVVVDSGDGILAEDLPRVFDPLYTTKPPGKGTGLGLAILRGGRGARRLGAARAPAGRGDVRARL